MTTAPAVRDRIAGPIVGLPVPFDRSLEVDHAGLHEHVTFLIERGIGVLMLSVGLSEYQHLSETEIRDVVRTVVQAGGKRAVVIVETGEWWTGAAMQFAREMEAAGADALMVVPPHPSYLPYSPAIHDDALYRHYAAVAQAARLPMLFHLRALRGRGRSEPWSSSLIHRVASIPSVIGVKDESGDPALEIELIETLGPKVVVIDDGGALSFCRAFAVGSPAWITGIGQFAPDLEVSFYADLQAGRMGDAEAFARSVATPFEALQERWNWVATIKAAMDLAGLAGGPMRPPTPALSEEGRAELAAFLATHGMLADASAGRSVGTQSAGLVR
jgi:dihydrodipicolinate synthase/N-acetylneuraminate lyase